jgi:heterodisulfide reductase subunit C
MINIPKPIDRREATKRLMEISGQDIILCLQCGKCTAGCPFADDMDLRPHQIVRLAQLGLTEELMECEAIYYCATCFTCVSRCPMAIDIAAISEAIRLLLQLDDRAKYGPDSVDRQMSENAPQQALVALYRKFGN